MAGHLLKYCHFVEDTEGYVMELRYIRDTDKREVDFVVLRAGSSLCDILSRIAPAVRTREKAEALGSRRSIVDGECDWDDD